MVSKVENPKSERIYSTDQYGIGTSEAYSKPRVGGSNPSRRARVIPLFENKINMHLLACRPRYVLTISALFSPEELAARVHTTLWRASSRRLT
jgi:hypothetical protein